MPSARKRPLHDVDADLLDGVQNPSMLQRIRNMWQFANLFQFILLFGKVIKVDDSLDIEDLEAECLKPHATALQEIGLCFLKFLSSHRGLTHDLFDEYTRRQFLAKAPDKNPFGTDETPSRFADFDVFKKIRTLQEMSQLIMINPERIRDKTEEQKDIDQANWRIEPYGWDRDDRAYFVLDDNRIYRQTETPPPAPKTKKASKKARASLRASKRRRISAAQASDEEEAGDADSESGPIGEEVEDDGLGGMKWECIAVTLDEVRQFTSSIQKSKDPNERVLRDRIQDHLVPILEKQEESRKRKQLQREKELLSLEKMAHAKRSSRLAGRAEKQKLEDQVREEEQKRREDEAAARKEEQKRLRVEHEREERLMSREKRLQEREARRLQHEEELAQLSESSKSVSAGAAAGRKSDRHIQAEIEKNKQALREIEEEEDDWIFDCVCGVYGQIDDGTHSVACESCNIWQHSKCLGVAEEEADRDDFHFICDSCRRRAAERDQRPRVIKIKVNRPGPAPSTARKAIVDSPPPQSAGHVIKVQSTLATIAPQVREAGSVGEGEAKGATIPTRREDQPSSDLAGLANGASFNGANPSLEASSNGPVVNPFSSPHPTLSPPGQSPNKSRAYNTILDQSSPVGSAFDRPNLGSGLGAQASLVSPVALALPTANGRVSPAKQPHLAPLPATKKPHSSPVAPAATPSTASNLVIGTPSIAESYFTPGPSQSQARPGPRYDERSSPLPPSRGGLSPTKHSPPMHQHQFGQANGVSSTNGATPLASAALKPSVLPPVTALSPSPQQPIMTPPVKPVEPARTALQPGQSLQAQNQPTSL